MELNEMEKRMLYQTEGSERQTAENMCIMYAPAIRKIKLPAPTPDTGSGAGRDGAVSCADAYRKGADAGKKQRKGS